jgi:hypothetical protein
MTPDEREQMFILCQRLAAEENRQRYTKYVEQMDELLSRKKMRLAERDGIRFDS